MKPPFSSWFDVVGLTFFPSRGRDTSVDRGRETQTQGLRESLMLLAALQTSWAVDGGSSQIREAAPAMILCACEDISGAPRDGQKKKGVSVIFVAEPESIECESCPPG